MPALPIFGGEPSQALLLWLEQQGLTESHLGLWVSRPEDPPVDLPAGPWVVLSEEVMSESQRQRWLTRLDEESTLLAPWSPSTLRPVLRPSLWDPASLARLYAQGGRALADHFVRDFLYHSPGLLQQAKQASSGGERYLLRLRELAGGVGASELQELLDQSPLDWDKLERELQAARRVFENQHRQDRTV